MKQKKQSKISSILRNHMAGSASNDNHQQVFMGSLNESFSNSNNNNNAPL
jgi:hypothetical protein